MRPIIFSLLVILLYSCQNNAQNGEGSVSIKELTSVSYDQIPRSLKFKGDFSSAWRWSDQNGENILVLSTESRYGGYDESQFLYGIHFAKQGGGYETIWKMIDHEKDCYFDLTCRFFPGATTITDLDGDGFAEIKLQYETACRSDVSGATMKLLMYENGKKRALRGTRWLNPYGKGGKSFPYGIDEMCKDRFRARDYNGGQYESDNDFADAPPSFLDHAKQEWRKYVVE